MTDGEPHLGAGEFKGKIEVMDYGILQLFATPTFLAQDAAAWDMMMIIIIIIL